MITNDDFNSSIGQFKNYTTLIGGMPPKTEVPAGEIYPVNVWAKQSFTPNTPYSLLSGSPAISVDNVIGVTSAPNDERKFVFTDLDIFENCVAIVGFTTPDNSVLKSFSIGALLRHDSANSKFVCCGIEGDGTKLYLKIKTFDGVSYSTIGTSIECTLSPATQYWLAAMAVDSTVRCEIWSSNPINNSELRETVITRTLPSGYSAKGEVGIANWKPSRTLNAAAPATITSFEAGYAFSNTIEGSLPTALNNSHVDIRSMINEMKTFPRFLQRLQGYHQSQNAYSQTLTLNTAPVSGTFKILLYNSDDTYLQPIESASLNWNASEQEIKTAVTDIVSLASQNYKFSRFNGDAVVSVTRSKGASCFPFTVEFNHFYGDLSFMRAKVENLLDAGNAVPSAETGYWEAATKIAMFKPSIEDRIYIQTGDPKNPHSTQDDLRSSSLLYSENWKLYSSEGGAINYPMKDGDISVEKKAEYGYKRVGQVRFPASGVWSFSMQSSMPSTAINAALPFGLENSSINISFLDLDPKALHLYKPNSGVWSNSTSYSINNVVEFGDFLYKSLQNSNLNHNPASSPTYWEKQGGGCYVQFTSNKSGLFYNQGGEALDDSARVYLSGKMIPSIANPATIKNYDFRATMSEFVNPSTNARFNFGSITGVRIVIYGGATGFLRVAGIRAIKTISPSDTYKPLSVDMNTRIQNVYAPTPLTDQSLVALPPMIRGTTLEGTTKDPFHLNGEGQIVVRTSDNMTNDVDFNKVQIYSRYRYSQTAEWITTEFGYNKSYSYIKTFKTYRARSLDDSNPEIYWDVIPGGVSTVKQVSDYPTWDPGTLAHPVEYSKGDIVEHKGHFYKALKDKLSTPSAPNQSIEPAPFAPNSSYWGQIDTISDLKGVQSSSRYIFSAALESNSATTSIDYYETSPERIYQDSKTSNQEWGQKSGRTGWYAEFIDDSEIESFTFESSGFAILRTKEILSDTPIDGAQLYTKDSGFKNAFEAFSSKNPDEVVTIDLTKSKSTTGSYRIDPKGKKYYPGFVSNQFTVNNWSNVFIEFDIWVPSDLSSENLKPKIYLQSADFTVLDENDVPVEYLGPLSFNFTQNVWSNVSKTLRDFEKYPTGEYFLIVASDEPHNKNFWIDNVKINQQTIEWEIRAIRGGAWYPFRNTVNKTYGAVHLPASQRGREIQLQARALTEDAWVSEYTLKPRYAALGRLLYADYRTGVVTGKGFVGQSEHKDVNPANLWNSGTTYAAGDIVEYNGAAYISLVGSNTNNTPSSSPTYWMHDGRSLPLDTKGIWTSARTYSQNQLVEYSSSNDGSTGRRLYISLQNSNTNKNPATQTAYWRLVSVSSEIGNSVAPNTYAAWSSIANYNGGDYVQFTDGGSTYFYICTEANSAKSPSTHPDYWRVYGDAGVWNTDVTYIVGEIIQRIDGGRNVFYVCIQDGANKDPLTQTSYWRKLYDMSDSATDAYAIHVSGKVSAGDIETSSAGEEMITTASSV